jgi:predicted Zn-dependent protease
LRINTLENHGDVIRYFSIRKNQGTKEQRAVARYGLGLFALKKQQFTKAENIFQQLVKEFPNQPQYTTALARTALDQRQYNIALARYRQAQKSFPRNSAIKFEYITTLLKSGYAKQAYQALKALNQKEKQQPNYYRLLAETNGALNEKAKSHRYMAEYYYATGQTHQAITQIKLAQKSKQLNFYLAAILDERLKYFTEEEKERKQDQ